jgi:hypothetical protein
MGKIKHLSRRCHLDRFYCRPNAILTLLAVVWSAIGPFGSPVVASGQAANSTLAPDSPGASPDAPAPDEFAHAWDFQPDVDKFRPTRLLDLGYLNELAAGQHGFIRLSPDGNSFVRGDGQPIRFWCIGSDEFRKPAAELATHARFLAKLGVNMVRLHAQIAPAGTDAAGQKTWPDLTDVNSGEIDSIWRAVAAYKKQGIYVTISPYWASDKSVEKWGIEGYSGQTDLWGILFFNPRLQAGYKAWARQLFLGADPYSPTPLAKDPAVALIEIQNEDSLFFWTLQSIKPPQQQLLAAMFAKWLITKYGSLDAAHANWQGNHRTGDDPGHVAIVPIGEWNVPAGDGYARRIDDEVHFLADTQRNFYAGMVSYYRDELGCQQLINACNWTTADLVRLNDLERYTYTAGDVVAVNKYFGGVHKGPNNGWRIDPGDDYTNNPAVLHPRDLPTNLRLVAGHPTIITESSWVSPMDDQCEGPLLMAAYQSLTGVAGFCWFATSVAQYNTDPFYPWIDSGQGRHPIGKWSCATPALMGQFPAAALIYRLGYLETGQPVIRERRTLDDLYSRKAPLLAEDGSFDPNRFAGDRAAQSAPLKVDPMAFLVGPVQVEYGSAAASEVRDISSFVDSAHKIVRSETGQIVMHYGEGYCTIDAPKAQAACGFLSKAGPIDLGAVRIDCGNSFASVAVVALDDQPLDQSGKLLVQFGTRVRPTGWREQAVSFTGSDGKTQYNGFQILDTGHAPLRVVDTRVTLTIRNTKIHRATLLDTGFYPQKFLPVTPAPLGCSVTLPDATMYMLLTPS